MVAGGVMSTGAICGFCMVVFGEHPWSILPFSPLMFFAGAGLGLLSCAYLAPLLWETRLSRSLPLVLGLSVPIGIGLGTVHPLFGAVAALWCQVAASVVVRTCLRLSTNPTRCRQCGYDCAGIRIDLCPECGYPAPGLALLNPGACPACSSGPPDQRGLCPTCGAIDLNRWVGDTQLSHNN